VTLSFFPLVSSQWLFCREIVHRDFTLFYSHRKTFLCFTERRKKWFYPPAGRSRSATVRDSFLGPKWKIEWKSGVYHPLSPVIDFGFRHPRKKERKEDRKKVGLSFFPLVLSQWPFCHETVDRNFTLFYSRRKTFLSVTKRRKKERQKKSWYVVLSTCIITGTVLPWDSRLRFNALLLSQKDFSFFHRKTFF